AKMDGAIIVDTAVKRLAWANVQLMPDPTIPSEETGTRHRTAERVAKQTGALVVSVSQQRETVTIFVGPARYQLDPVPDVLAEATVALGGLRALGYQDLLDFDRLAELLGYPRGVNPLDHSVQPRGYRVLSHIPRLPEPVIRQVVGDLGTLDSVVRASQRDLEG